MSWEDRDGRRYDYRATRRDRRTVKPYLGPGPAAELAARLDLRARRQREKAAGLLRAERARADPADRAARDFEAAGERLVSAPPCPSGGGWPG